MLIYFKNLQGVLLNENSNNNLVVSPISAHITLGMISIGANGLTAQQIKDSLFYNKKIEVLYEFYKVFPQLLKVIIF